MGNDPYAYYNVFLDRWRIAQDWLNVEHDIVLHEEVIPQLIACPEWWCTFGYPGIGFHLGPPDGFWYESLGCTRFRRELMESYPRIMQQVGEVNNHKEYTRRDWRMLDARIKDTIVGVTGRRPHHHEPPVNHHHIYPRGCSCGGPCK